MSEAKHTPGPYHVEGGSIWAEAPDGTNLKIATTHPVLFYVSVSERNSNADLFSAAPVLLKVLHELCRMIAFDPPETLEVSIKRVYDDARAAIAKAEGRS